MEKRLSCLCLFPRSVFGSYKRTLVALQLFLRLLLFLEESLTSALVVTAAVPVYALRHAHLGARKDCE